MQEAHPDFDFIFPGSEKARIQDAIEHLTGARVIERLWEHDHLLWQDSPDEVINRMGWLHSPVVMQDAVDEINRFVDQIRSEGFTRVLLLGMGGSSLAPEVFRMTFGTRNGYPDLQILDSTDPGQVLSRDKYARAGKTLFIVATKSGGTVETISFMKYFYRQVASREGEAEAGQYFAAITDPDSGLEKMAGEMNFRKIFLNDPNIGGRFSALSYFGLVPAAVIGVDIGELLNRAEQAASACRINNDRSAIMGAAIGKLAEHGRDKLCFILSPGISYLGVWIEQLVAESTGKSGKGVLPVDREELFEPGHYRDDRIFVHLYLREDGNHNEAIEKLKQAGFPVIETELADKYDLAAEFFRWEIATAVAGHFLGINPYDQPNVESAKKIARKRLDDYMLTGRLQELNNPVRMEIADVYGAHAPGPLNKIITQFLEQLPDKEPFGYVAIQAYLNADPMAEALLRNLQSAIAKKYHVATTCGFGPRFLHSTGQLHKGDAGNGLFIQINGMVIDDVRIPDTADSDKSGITFGIVRQAQSLGDLQALLDNGRKVLRIDLLVNDLEGIRQIIAAINLQDTINE